MSIICYYIHFMYNTHVIPILHNTYILYNIELKFVNIKQYFILQKTVINILYLLFFPKVVILIWTFFI